MDNATRERIILAAASSVVADDSTKFAAAVKERAVDIMLMLDEKSAVSKFLAEISGASVFTGVLRDIVPDPRTRRGIVHIETNGQYADDDGIETLATAPSYTDEGYDMISRLIQLRDHKVTVWKKIEPFTDSDGKPKKSKVIVRVEDHGPVREAKAPAENHGLGEDAPAERRGPARKARVA